MINGTNEAMNHLFNMEPEEYEDLVRRGTTVTKNNDVKQQSREIMKNSEGHCVRSSAEF